MKWQELNVKSNRIELDKSVIDDEISLFPDEYDVAVALVKGENDDVVVEWVNNKDNSVSYSTFDNMSDELVEEVLKSIVE